jgi:hypothetical protein
VLLSGLVLFPLYISSVNAFIPFGALALGVILYTLFHPSLRRQAEADEVPVEDRTDGPPQGGPGDAAGDADVEVAAAPQGRDDAGDGRTAAAATVSDL